MNEPEGAWHQHTVTIYNSGENLWIDDVKVTVQ